MLDAIVTAKRTELKLQEVEFPMELLRQHINDQHAPLNLSGALMGNEVRLIAEIKKASPSKGLLCPDFDPVRLARIYSDNGAAAISVLTDARFEGSLEHLKMVKREVRLDNIPVLRKDFIFTPYQIYESRAFGADAILLIVAILDPYNLRHLLQLSHQLWMQCLVEVHNESEMALAIDAGAEIIGINNRDLHTFDINPSLTESLAPKGPPGKILVSESGITTKEQFLQLKRLRVHAALVGEALVTSPDVSAKVRELTGATST